MNGNPLENAESDTKSWFTAGLDEAAALERPGPRGTVISMSLHQKDVSMRPFDFAPLYRSTVGFDRLVQLLDSAAGLEAEAPAYPPYNIERLGENEYRITMAVAGFAQSEIKLEVKEQTLTVTGQKSPEAKEREFLHRGIAGRAFERRFQLADHVEVSGADLKDGLLDIGLKRNVPERLKPRTIAIGQGQPAKQLQAAE